MQPSWQLQMVNSIYRLQQLTAISWKELGLGRAWVDGLSADTPPHECWCTPLLQLLLIALSAGDWPPAQTSALLVGVCLNEAITRKEP